MASFGACADYSRGLNLIQSEHLYISTSPAFRYSFCLPPFSLLLRTSVLYSDNTCFCIASPDGRQRATQCRSAEPQPHLSTLQQFVCDKQDSVVTMAVRTAVQVGAMSRQ
ncbi:hypothetical protein BaRGS_00001049 [Batillaria attramentaria]|uniref:Uncharacterized protein n=1 Tax=Batillaria attramentaria TaxID=370345 RepID=A0ABD0M6S0_9CAEN